MVCEHLINLNKFIKDNKIQVSSQDLVHFVCTKCKLQDTCPTTPVYKKDE